MGRQVPLFRWRGRPLVLAATIFAACGTTEIRDEFAFSLTITGGFEGEHLQIDVDSGAKTIVQRAGNASRSAPLDPDALRSIRTGIEGANFMHLREGYHVEGWSDNYHYSATLTTSGKTYRVSWDGHAGAPEALTALVPLLMRFAGEPPRAGD